MSSRYAEASLNQRDPNRTQLFGSGFETAGQNANNSSRYSAYNNPNDQLDYSESSLAQLESQSDENMSTMGAKIKALKSLSLKMGDEIRSSNQNLGDLEHTFHSTSAKLKNTFNSMVLMAETSKISIKTWTTIFFVVFLIFFWVWIF